MTIPPDDIAKRYRVVGMYAWPRCSDAVAMAHTTRDGGLGIVKSCSCPLTAVRCMHTIFTDVAVIRVTATGLRLEETAPGWSVEDVQAITEPRLDVSPTLHTLLV
jgi:3-oxoacid CoA-transferase subunit B